RLAPLERRLRSAGRYGAPKPAAASPLPPAPGRGLPRRVAAATSALLVPGRGPLGIDDLPHWSQRPRGPSRGRAHDADHRQGENSDGLPLALRWPLRGGRARRWLLAAPLRLHRPPRLRDRAARHRPARNPRALLI